MPKKHQIPLRLKAFGPSSDQNLPESSLRSAIINKALTILILKGHPRGKEAKTTSFFVRGEMYMHRWPLLELCLCQCFYIHIKNMHIEYHCLGINQFWFSFWITTPHISKYGQVYCILKIIAWLALEVRRICHSSLFTQEYCKILWEGVCHISGLG